MRKISRRTVLASAAAAGATVAAGGLPVSAASAAPPPSGIGRTGHRVHPGDPTYLELTTGNNQRFVSRPDYIRMITSTRDAERAVREAVRAGKRVSVRSGGHCFSDFVCNPEIEVVLDLSGMTSVYYDVERRAFAVEAGARLMNVYEALYKGWGVTIPGGICYSVGVGGHVAGGGYGLLSRAHGLVVDHLYAVEVVVVDGSGRVRTVVATRERSDPDRDLWWGHTGGGGGNFGVVTRYWFRSPGATGAVPGEQLVAPPSTVLVSAVSFPWDKLTEGAFARLLTNFGAWHAANSAPDSPTVRLSSLFNVSHRAHGSLGMFTQVDATAPGAEQLLTDYLSALTEGVGVAPEPATASIGELGPLPGLSAPRRLPWLQATRLVGTDNPTITDPTSRAAHKSAYMLKNFTGAQLTALYKYMTQEDFTNPDTMLVLFSFGGRVNAVPPTGTANAQRGTIFKMCFQTFWSSARDDAFHLRWIRGLYAEFFGATGGVPVPGGAADGCYINYPDNDVADPRYNRSGVSWQTLYYKENYPRLQQVKQRWDPTNFFRHALSIELPNR